MVARDTQGRITIAPPPNGRGELVRLVLAAQGAFYLFTGLWPLVSMRTFELVTGDKTDEWLVRMVGLLAAAIGAALLTASITREMTRPILVLAVGAALSFAAIDIYYVAVGRISAIYLGDAAAELMLIAGLAWGVVRSKRSKRRA